MSIGNKTKLAAAAAVFGLMAVPLPAHAQDNGGGGNNGGGRRGGGQGGGGGGGWDPAQMKQRMMDRMKEQLQLDDEQFSALEPKIDKVMTARMEVMAGQGGMMGGRRGGGRQGGGGGGMMGNSASAKASQELQTTLDNKDAKPEEIKAKLEALRSARTKAKAELTKAQDDLKGLLTARQEAVMVEMGMLE